MDERSRRDIHRHIDQKTARPIEERSEDSAHVVGVDRLDHVPDTVRTGNVRAAVIGGDDGHVIPVEEEVPEDERQDTLRDRSEPDDHEGAADVTMSGPVMHRRAPLGKAVPSLSGLHGSIVDPGQWFAFRIVAGWADGTGKASGMKIWVFETDEWEEDACVRLGQSHDVRCERGMLDARTVATASDAEVVTTFINSRLTADVLAQMPSLRLIATRSTGFDHIDMDYARDHGIVVCNVPDYGDHTVAEHSFALLLALARHIPEAAERTRHGDFSQVGTCGFDLRGKTLGVVGVGRIGRRVIEIARGFGMDVVANDIVPDPACGARLGFRYCSLPDLLRISDIISLHVPATADTHGLLSDAEFGEMKQGGVLINTARGNVVDTEALVRALASGRVGAAGLDVLPEEPLTRDEAQIFRADAGSKAPDLRALVANHVLLRFPNVIVTPHIAFNTREAKARIIETTIRNIEAFASGSPQNKVV